MYSLYNKRLTEKSTLLIDFRYDDVALDFEGFLRDIDRQIQRHIASDTNLGKVYGELNSEFVDSHGKLFNELSHPKNRDEARLIQKVIVYSRALYETQSCPLCIVIDNLDLCSKNFQVETIKQSKIFLSSVIKDDNSFSSKRCKNNSFNLVIAIRPETAKKFGELTDVKTLYFPVPSVYDICVNNFRMALEVLVKDDKYKHQNCLNLTLHDDVIINSYTDLYHFLLTRIEDIKSNWAKFEKNYSRNYLDVDFVEFHNKLTNNNIRKFNSFLINCLRTGGFLPLTHKFNSERRRFRVYDYLRMLILGGYDIFPGNAKMDGEMFDKESPLVFNLFDLQYDNSSDRSDENVIRNYSINIRILQYFDLMLGRKQDPTAAERTIDSQEIINALRCFFDEKHIQNALKQMIFAGIISEVKIGSATKEMGDTWRHIQLETKKENGEAVYAAFLCSYDSTAMFYLYDLLCEYEYIYQMAQASRSYHYIDGSLPFEEKKMAVEEKAVLRFLHSFFDITKKNIEIYKKSVACKQYKDFFTDDYRRDLHSIKYADLKTGMYPWNRMIHNYIKVLEHKIEIARHEFGSYETDKTRRKQRREELDKLKKDAEDLQKYGEEYLKDF